MSESLSEIAVVGEENETFGLRIEAPNIEEARIFFGQKIEYGVASVHIFSRRDETRRFVQHDGEQSSGMNQFAVHFDIIARGRVRTEIGADLAVDSDAAGGNYFITMTPRPDASGSEEAIEAQEKELQGQKCYIVTTKNHSNAVTL